MVFELVYSSVISPTADVRGVADIVRRARSYNRSHGLTGILVFDGQRFCQLLEGERDQVLRLAARIEADPRHEEYTLLHQGESGPQRRYGEWHMAYALDTHGAVLESLARTRGEQVAGLLQSHTDDLEFQPAS